MLKCTRPDIQRALGQPRKAQHAAAHGFPPAALEEARATGTLDDALDRLGRGALRAFAALGATERRAAVGEEDGVEPPRTAVRLASAQGRGRHAVGPVDLRLDGERRPRGSHEEEVHPGPVAPFLGGGVGENGTRERRCRSTKGSAAKCAMPKCPGTKEKLRAEVVIMIQD